MAIDFSQLRKAEDTSPPLVVLYAGAKSGKTTLASEFPAPYYCRASEGERAPKGVSMVSFGVSETYEDVTDQMDWMMDSEANDQCQTFVVDALDGLERLIRAEACKQNGWADIEEPGFGKGYAAELAIWHKFVAKCLRLKGAGFFVVLIAHVKAKTVPGVLTDSYPRYMPNLRDDAIGAVVDAADLIGFIHQRASVQKEEAGFKKTNNRGTGSGELLIAVQERPGFIAGNRYKIKAATIPFKEGEGFNALAKASGWEAANDNTPAGEEEDAA